jgi:hypothetical protein
MSGKRLENRRRYGIVSVWPDGPTAASQSRAGSRTRVFASGGAPKREMVHLGTRSLFWRDGGTFGFFSIPEPEAGEEPPPK